MNDCVYIGTVLLKFGNGPWCAKLDSYHTNILTLKLDFSFCEWTWKYMKSIEFDNVSGVNGSKKKEKSFGLIEIAMEFAMLSN